MQTITTVILSQPRPPIWQLGAIHAFINLLFKKKTFSGITFCAIFCLTKSTTLSLLITSQIPSQAKTMNS
ncbi:hypothetical protein BpHYR1_000084 [Brachionus plicatilis]|uniref:Uncharacterized protein n=1 Tax=Brachionus plicatilis TaxID=10195 RepID=A0A3M7SNY3_BRAPC|nr:hypothetical protein BpHYR1_000084 [Brachionus plicatilis]